MIYCTFMVELTKNYGFCRDLLCGYPCDIMIYTLRLFVT